MALVTKKKKPPPGAIPLFAMGHNPEYDAAGESDYYLGPYGKHYHTHTPVHLTLPLPYTCASNI
jgi:hypothetical protein